MGGGQPRVEDKISGTLSSLENEEQSVMHKGGIDRKGVKSRGRKSILKKSLYRLRSCSSSGAGRNEF